MTTYRDRHLALEAEAKKQAKAQKTQAAKTTSKAKSK